MDANQNEEEKCSKCKELLDDDEHQPVQYSCGCLICSKCKNNQQPQDGNQIHCDIHNQNVQICYLSPAAAKAIVALNNKPTFMNCNCDQQKPIENFCGQCKEFFCSACMLKHVEHFNELEATSFKKIQNNASLIAVHINDLKQALDQYLTDLKVIQKFKKNISASFIKDTLNKSVKALTQPFISQEEVLVEIQQYTD